jgi:hypothetical protein
MAVLNTLAVNTLALRGAGNEFNKFSRFFKTLEEARESVASGDYNPTEGVTNAVLVLGAGIMIWSFDLQDFVSLADFAGAGNQSDKYIELDGVNDYIEFTGLTNGAADVLDFTKDWSIGVTLVGVTGPASSSNMALFGRGGIQINLKAQAGSTNWGLYVTSDNDLYNGAKRAQANTWYAPSDFSRILFTYEAATRRLKYYLGDPATGVYAQRANLAIPQSMVDGQNLGSTLCVGKSWSGVGGAGFSGINWDGGVNNLVASDIVLSGPFIQEYFQDQSGDPDALSSDSFTTAEYYPDLVAFAKLGEDVFPNVVDSKSNLTGGALISGTASDFVDIPEA